MDVLPPKTPNAQLRVQKPRCRSKCREADQMQGGNRE